MAIIGRVICHLGDNTRARGDILVLNRELQGLNEGRYRTNLLRVDILETYFLSAITIYITLERHSAMRFRAQLYRETDCELLLNVAVA
jgi:hypothetical protein